MRKDRSRQRREDSNRGTLQGDLPDEPVSRKIHLDFNASTPICPEAVEAIRPFLFDHYGNPYGQHPVQTAAT
jgi:hypothetical protein